MKRNIYLGLLCCVYAVGAFAQKQDDAEHRWAVSLHANANWQQATKNEYPSSARQMGLGWKLEAEYYLPDSPFSLKAGYDSESLEAFSSSHSVSLEQISVGGRYYIPVSDFPIKPYLGADGLLNIGTLDHGGQMEEWDFRVSQQVPVLKREFDVRSPRFSFAPVAGIDVNILTCVALQLEYGFRMGIGSHYTIHSQDMRTGKTYETRFKGMRHVLSFGVKVNFPFRLTRGDGQTVMDWILGD